jgi:SWI/SNF-related matrix-associated actin-dependent regulator of chromatin subfamily A member 5
MTEAEEDSALLKTAQSKRRVVRLDHQPSNLSEQCKMHKYQLEGLNWLIKLHDHGINGILADEMGLGKTLQTISLLAYLRESRGVRGPHIVIVPKSVVGNWCREFKKWCPNIKAIKMGGTKEERQRFVAESLPLDPVTGKRKWDVLVTSYEGLLKEKGKFGKIPWRYLIIDEAHRIKNENSSLSVAVRNIKTEFRLLITGTPLQNNLRELWALLNFLMPDIFGDAEQFDEWFSLSDESGKENVIKKLHTVLRPFMLRRVKKDVATDLPPKKETKLYIGLSAMQQEWYVRCLQKDAHELNKLGGPDRNRLLNVLMQLRKVCNHPYLFDGAEKGPPYVDGPHLWENSGKMSLLNKLLPKLKQRGSRVLIFSQMTRMLDIMEDYCRLVGHEYCRIDGNTDGEKRDSQMDEFNADGSSKFLFLLSTRAGGLGINLATADIVIIFDSDWNPQVDLQAMDRAHRIGQKKPVQVFRFVSQDTVEEKIIERADRKLFLDAAVIQQGRLAEQNNKLDKGDLMKMVRFGADQILSGKGGTYTDEDVDALIARGEQRTTEMQAKLETNAQHTLADFSLIDDTDAGIDTFAFGGKNYRDSDKPAGNFINLPQRQRKRNYDLNAPSSVGQTSGMKAHAADAAAKKKRKGPALHDFQLFNMVRLNALIEKERALAFGKERQLRAISDTYARASNAPPVGSGVAQGQSYEELTQSAKEMESNLDSFKLNDAEEKEKAELLSEGFPDWSRKDYKAFCASMEQHGRYDFASVSRDVMSETGKVLQEIQRYFVAFWTNYERISDWSKVIEKIERGEKKIFRSREIRDAIQEKVERHLEDTFGSFYGKESPEKIPPVAELLHYSWPKMKINYGSSGRGRGYQEEEDAFLVCMMYRHGYGAAERIRMEIRRAWQFRFDWFFKSRSAREIQKRCDLLVRVLERENEELRKKEEEEVQKKNIAEEAPVEAPVAAAAAMPAQAVNN